MNLKEKVLIVGCSFANNHWIFLETVTQLIKNTYDIVLVAWTAVPRFNFHVGLELYNTETLLFDMDVNVNNQQTVSGRWLKSLGDGLRKIQNDHWDYLELVKYVNVLKKIQHGSGGQIFFCNSLLPWCDGYFDHKKIQVPSDLSVYEQNLLSVETRDDHEVLAIYNMIHEQYGQYGGIQESLWLNLYQSLENMKVDQISNVDYHPGYQSQQKYISYLGPILNRKLNKQ